MIKSLKLITDEATFHINGCVNHNCFIWGSQLPTETTKTLVGLQNWMFGMTYNWKHQDLLETCAFQQTGYWEAVTGNNIVFRQDGAPHFLTVREAWNERFPNARIGRDGPIPWSARSPDLTPLDINIVYSESITNIGHLITAAIATPDSAQNLKGDDYRRDMCHKTNCAHVETLKFLTSIIVPNLWSFVY